MSSPGLGYVLAHPDRMGLVLEQPLWLLLALPALGFLWFARGRPERLAALLRLGALVCLALGLGRVGLSSSLPTDTMTVIAVVDHSDSIDSTGREWSHRFVDQLAAALAPGDDLGVVTFAADARVARPPTAPEGMETLASPVLRSATDISRGLGTALAMLPAGTAHRIVLLSDGNETRGNARALIPRLRAARAPVFAAVPPRASLVDVSVDKVTVPSLVADGAVFPVRVVARNSHGPRPAKLTMMLDGTVIGREEITLGAGLNALEIPYRWSGSGSHRLRVTIEAEGDQVHGNDYREVTLMVAGPPRVLVVTSQPHPPVAAALSRKDFAVDVQPPDRLAQSPEAFLGYNAVVAENVAAGEIAAPALAALERWVRDYGGGFVFAGGQRSFGDPRFKATPLEAMLPVTLEPRRPPPRERDPVALMLVLDRSNSMGYASAADGTTLPQRDPATSKLHYAKQAALSLIRQLKDHDYVGLIAFDSLAYEISPLLPLAENRADLERKIPLLVENGGTDFYDALDAALQQLSSLRIGTRHTVLLTDGDTNRHAEDHYPLIAAMAAAKISVTTIRIGDDVVNLSLLNDISSRTGGRFYHIENVTLLPQLLLRDANAAIARAPTQELEILPQAGAASQLLRGIKPGFPVLRDYAFARARRGADIAIFVPGREEREPILASWQYGLGRVAAFTADSREDADAWVGWESFGKLWSQIVRWTMRGQTPWDFFVEAERRDGRAKLLVRAFDGGHEGALIARVHVDAERTEDLTLIPVAPRRYEAELPPAVGGGRYPVTLLSRRATGDVTQRTEMVPIPAADAEPQEEFQTTHPNTTLLEQIAVSSGGKLDPTVREIAAREPGERRLVAPLDRLLVPLAMLLFLGDVAIRRLWLPRTP